MNDYQHIKKVRMSCPTPLQLLNLILNSPWGSSCLRNRFCPQTLSSTIWISRYRPCLLIPPTFVSPDCLIFVLLSGIIHDHSVREMNMFKSRTNAMPEMWCNLSNE